MAGKTVKIAKANNGKGKGTEVADESAEEVEEDESVEVSEETEPAPADKAALSEEEDTLIFTAFDDITPAPHIGNWSGLQHLGIKTMKKGQPYRVPREVALQLKDSKRGVVSESIV